LAAQLSVTAALQVALAGQTGLEPSRQLHHLQQSWPLAGQLIANILVSRFLVFCSFILSFRRFSSDLSDSSKVQKLFSNGLELSIYHRLTLEYSCWFIWYNLYNISK